MRVILKAKTITIFLIVGLLLGAGYIWFLFTPPPVGQVSKGSWSLVVMDDTGQPTETLANYRLAWSCSNGREHAVARAQAKTDSDTKIVNGPGLMPTSVYFDDPEDLLTQDNDIVRHLRDAQCIQN